MPAPTDTTLLKRHLRDEYRRRRAAIPPDDRDLCSSQIADRLLALPANQAARTIYAYQSFGSEVETTKLLTSLAFTATTILLAPNEKVHHPPPDLDIPSIDLFIVPGIVWDHQGYRIGYGGGYFDRLLAAARPTAIKIGLAFDEQLVPTLPHASHDIPVQTIITPTQSINCVP